MNREKRLEQALREIADSNDIDNALDPERNKRLARAALCPPLMTAEDPTIEIEQLRAKIAAADTETERLRAQIAAALGALEPFGKHANDWSDYADTENLIEPWRDGPDNLTLTVGHLRAAAQCMDMVEQNLALSKATEEEVNQEGFRRV